MSQKTGEAIFWIIVIVLNVVLLAAGGYGGRGSDYHEYQDDSVYTP